MSDKIGLTDGDVQAKLAKEVPEFPEKPNDIYKTVPTLLEAKRRIIAVSGNNLRDNAYRTAENMFPVIEIWEPTSEGAFMMRDAKLVMGARHVEILGPSRIYHDPVDPLDDSSRRVAVMVTEAPIRVYLDTPEQVELTQTRAATTGSWGC